MRDDVRKVGGKLSEKVPQNTKGKTSHGGSKNQKIAGVVKPSDTVCHGTDSGRKKKDREGSDVNLELPPRQKQKTSQRSVGSLAGKECCSCSRYSTCNSVARVDRAGCACRVAGRLCTGPCVPSRCGKCVNRVQHKKIATPNKSKGTLASFFGKATQPPTTATQPAQSTPSRPPPKPPGPGTKPAARAPNPYANSKRHQGQRAKAVRQTQGSEAEGGGEGSEEADKEGEEEGVEEEDAEQGEDSSAGELEVEQEEEQEEGGGDPQEEAEAEEPEVEENPVPEPRMEDGADLEGYCLLYTSPSPRDLSTSRMPSSA